ncbi:MAG TPA: hypothetical protein VKY27_11800 [Bacteriovoracaceae bacterium]|nr:hypothetical protein [Bacteriovoracaceae bacterium]
MIKWNRLLTFTLLCPLGLAQAQEIITGHIGGISNQVDERVGDVPGNKFIGELRFNYKKDYTSVGTELERAFSLAVNVNDQSLTQYSIPEAYVGGKLSKKDYIRFGRQVLNWAEVDKVWGFGKLNNRIGFDGFDPGQEGLTGLLYERRSSNGMRYRAFLSGIYVPELNPSLDIDKKDKTITSRHPWADPPSATAEIDPGNVKRIAYEVDYPEYHEVIYKYTVGASLGYESKHWVWDGFIIRKPENRFTPEAHVSLNSVDDLIEAQVKPHFHHHDVYGSTLKYRNLDLEMYISGIAVRPLHYPEGDRDAFRATKIKSEKMREDYLGGGISRVNDIYSIGFNYVARLSPYDRDAETLTEDPRWNQAINIFAVRNFWGQKLSLRTDLKFDMMTTDRLFMFEALYKATKHLHLSAGVKLIGTPGDGDSYWSPYTNNDSIYGGLRYAF